MPNNSSNSRNTNKQTSISSISRKSSRSCRHPNISSFLKSTGDSLLVRSSLTNLVRVLSSEPYARLRTCWGRDSLKLQWACSTRRLGYCTGLSCSASLQRVLTGCLRPYLLTGTTLETNTLTSFSSDPSTWWDTWLQPSSLVEASTSHLLKHRRPRRRSTHYPWMHSQRLRCLLS